MNPSPITSSSPSYLLGLNDAQKQAVLHESGALLVLAGAGTGKTRTLTARIAHLIDQGLARPHELLAVTFTNKAASAMMNRIASMTGRDPASWWIGTFHAITARMLRQDGECIGLKQDFTILDADDQLRLLKQIITDSGWDERQYPARLMRSLIQNAKNQALGPDRAADALSHNPLKNILPKIYQNYQDRLGTLNAVDFGDLIRLCLDMLRENSDRLDHYRNRFRYVLVDEYQDTNTAQYLWLRLLISKNNHLCCVGDDDQSIYGWRGAEIGNILRFEADFPGATLIRLEQNYRSSGHILACAGALIDNNRSRLGKTLWTADSAGEKPHILTLANNDEEAHIISDHIQNLIHTTMSASDIAILVRTGTQMRAFEERFLTIGLPYRVIGGPRFYERLEIRDALAYLRLIHTPSDDLAFERIINKPKRGIGATTIKALRHLSQAERISLTEAAEQLITKGEIRGTARTGLTTFIEKMKCWRKQTETCALDQLTLYVLEDSHYLAMWRNDLAADSAGRLDNLRELVTAVADFPSLADFLEHVSLVMENQADTDADKVSLMTLHAAKGLEFEAVFLPGWEEGLFPNARALDEQGERGLEEERRLAYVGLTRTRRLAFISHAHGRRLYGHWQPAVPSRFIRELPTEHTHHLTMHPFRQRPGPTLADYTEARIHKNLSTLSESPVFASGDRVFHHKFGYGTITDAQSDKASVQFDQSDKKVVLLSFIVPADQAC